MAAEPPDTKHPPAPSGNPARSANHSSTWFSAHTAPAASSHEMPFSDEIDTTVSNNNAAFVGAAGMNERNRGESTERMCLASTSRNCANTASGSLPSSHSSDGAAPASALIVIE